MGEMADYYDDRDLQYEHDFYPSNQNTLTPPMRYNIPDGNRAQRRASRKPRGKIVDRQCKECNASFAAREADVKRGWAMFCSKSCKAIKQIKKR